jgi:hypothetical protein
MKVDLHRHESEEDSLAMSTMLTMVVVVVAVELVNYYKTPRRFPARQYNKVKKQQTT